MIRSKKNLRAYKNKSVYAGISPVGVPLAADPFFFAGGLHPLRLGPGWFFRWASPVSDRAGIRAGPGGVSLVADPLPWACGFRRVV